MTITSNILEMKQAHWNKFFSMPTHLYLTVFDYIQVRAEIRAKNLEQVGLHFNVTAVQAPDNFNGSYVVGPYFPKGSSVPSGFWTQFE